MPFLNGLHGCLMYTAGFREPAVKLANESDKPIAQTKRKFKATTDSKHDKPISPNFLDREFKVSRPDQVYVGDITYMPAFKFKYAQSKPV